MLKNKPSILVVIRQYGLFFSFLHLYYRSSLQRPADIPHLCSMDERGMPDGALDDDDPSTKNHLRAGALPVQSTSMSE